MRPTWPAHLTLIHLIILFDEGASYEAPRNISFFFGPNILVGTLISNSLILFFN
jgi:hypothetical protein